MQVGEIECFHRFCWPCISTWSRTETTCPMCKVKTNFDLAATLSLPPFFPQSHHSIRLHATCYFQVGFSVIRRKRLADQLSPGDEKPLKRLKGTVMEEQAVEQRKQVAILCTCVHKCHVLCGMLYSLGIIVCILVGFLMPQFPSCSFLAPFYTLPSDIQHLP